ncbi:MAG: hypothetical protein JWR26_947, partial [Pedosphaera sp.]|nr:hypothetical protein [Pedosphaera sp.]
MKKVSCNEPRALSPSQKGWRRGGRPNAFGGYCSRGGALPFSRELFAHGQHVNFYHRCIQICTDEAREPEIGRDGDCLLIPQRMRGDEGEAVECFALLIMVIQSAADGNALLLHLAELPLDHGADALDVAGGETGFAEVDGEGGVPGVAGGSVIEVFDDALFHVVHVAGAVEDGDGAGAGQFLELGLEIIDDVLVARLDEDGDQVLHVGRQAVDLGEVAFETAKSLDEGEFGDGLQFGIGADELQADLENAAEERAAIHDLHEGVEGGIGGALLAGFGRDGVAFADHEALDLEDGEIAVQEIGAVVIDGVQLENEAEGFGEGGLHGEAFVGLVLVGRGSGVNGFGRSGAGFCNATGMGFRIHTFKQHQRLGVQQFLERVIIIRFADVGGANEQNGRPATMGGEEFADGDLQLDGVGVGVGDAGVGLGFEVGEVGCGDRGRRIRVGGIGCGMRGATTCQPKGDRSQETEDEIPHEARVVGTTGFEQGWLRGLAARLDDEFLVFFERRALVLKEISFCVVSEQPLLERVARIMRNMILPWPPKPFGLPETISALWIALIVACIPAASFAQSSYVNFEGKQTSPVRVSPDGTRLFAVNTPDGRLSVFDITHPSNPALLAEIPVGVEPVSVSPRTADEIWVVNEVSDSISIVSVSQKMVTDTLYVKDEPADVVFAGGRAFVSAARKNQVVVFDVTNHTQLAVIPIFGENPRGLAVNTNGTKVYAAFALSGNHTTLIPAASAPPQPPPTTITNAPPQVGLIVDARDPNWTNIIKFKMPDNDVAEIDVATLSLSRYFTNVGTVNLGIAINPASGDLFVANTDARNLTRFEPNVRGHIVTNRVTRINITSG